MCACLYHRGELGRGAGWLPLAMAQRRQQQRPADGDGATATATQRHSDTQSASAAAGTVRRPATAAVHARPRSLLILAACLPACLAACLPGRLPPHRPASSAWRLLLRRAPLRTRPHAVSSLVLPTRPVLHTRVTCDRPVHGVRAFACASEACERATLPDFVHLVQIARRTLRHARRTAPLRRTAGGRLLQRSNAIDRAYRCNSQAQW